MRIALNLLYLIPGVVGGTQTYAQGLVHGLSAIDQENEYRIYVCREAACLPLAEASNFKRIVCPVSARKRPFRLAWEQVVLPAVLHHDGIDVVHSLGYIGPVIAPCPHVVTIHDVNYIGHGTTMAAGKRGLLGLLVPLVARSARAIITVSEFSRDEIVRHIGIPSDRIAVAHQAAREMAPGANNIGDALCRYHVDMPYIAAFTGSLPHKNMARLIQAFAKICDSVPHNLVLIGSPVETGQFEGLGRDLGVSDRILITGYVADEDVMPLLAGADLFVFPSLYEGFGLPLLEAQRAGTAVASSTAGALREVAGSSVAFFNPESVEDMAATVLKTLLDPARLADLVSRGNRNLSRFSWEQAAVKTRDVYRQVVRKKTARR